MLLRLLLATKLLLCVFTFAIAQPQGSRIKQTVPLRPRAFFPARPGIHTRARYLEPFILEASKRYGVDPQIVRTICFLESRYTLKAISPKGARGPMQLMPETAHRYGVTNPHDPHQAIDAGAHYLRDLLMRFRGRVDLTLAAYNAGEGTVEAFRTGRSITLANGKVINPAAYVTGGIPPYRETREYVRAALLILRKQARPLLPSSVTSRSFFIEVPF